MINWGVDSSVGESVMEGDDGQPGKDFTAVYVHACMYVYESSELKEATVVTNLGYNIQPEHS